MGFVQLNDVTAPDAARELMRRRRARDSLVAFAQAIDIPGAPIDDDPDAWLFQPIGEPLALHHRVMLEAIQRCIETPYGRLMLFFPPGAAKTTYTTVVATAWAMGRRPGFKVINTSYSDVPAHRSSRRCRQIVGSPAYRSLWPEPVGLLHGSAEVKEWTLTNDSTALWSGLLGSITSARADLAIIDDPVSGREDADSETMRRKTWDAYNDDFKTRYKPGASVIIMQTRWHEDDLSGRLLPANYDGRSGHVLCRDGKVWEVLNVPAKCERIDDPLGRQIGEYLWPEWFDPEHWRQYEDDKRNPRTWSALYQQRPAPDEGGQFERVWFQRFDPGQEPASLRRYGASDYAVTEESLETDPDYTEHGIFGVDAVNDIWVLAWWSGQEAPDTTVDAFIDLVDAWKPIAWVCEGGVIRRAIEGIIRRRMRERQKFVAIDYLPTTQDKVASAAGFRGLASARVVHVPNTPWGDALIAQLCAFPMARYKDKVDVCGLFGRALASVFPAEAPPPGPDAGPPPGSADWWAARDRRAHQSADEQRANDFYAG